MIRFCAAVALLLLAGCGGSPAQPSATPTSIPSPTPSPAPSAPQFIFNVEPGVSAADESAVRSGFDLALAYFQRTFGWTATRNITINVTMSSGTSSGTATATALTFNTRAEAWVQRGTMQFHQETVAHELFHLMQLNVGWSGPVWLTEGSAEFIGWQVAIIGQGVYSFADARTCQIAGVTVFSSTPVPPLSELEDTNFYTVNNMRSNTYAAGWMASDELTKDRGIQALGEFGRSIGEWRIRFQSVFGMSVSDFYTRFELLRGTWSRSRPTFSCVL